MLRVLADGPLAAVTSLGFRQDAQSGRLILQAASLDKTVHAWVETADRDAWKYAPDRLLRVPIGRDYFGSLSAMAISDDGEWLAVGGRGRIAGLIEEHEEGRMMPVSAAFSPSMWEDLGTITVFELSTGTVRQLRGHTGAVQELAFAPGAPPVLVSASVERQPDGTESGKVRVWDVAQDRLLATLPRLPADTSRKPDVTALRVGSGLTDVLVAIAWSERNSPQDRLRVWDVAAGTVAQVELNQHRWLNVAQLTPQGRTLLAGTDREFGLWTLPAGARGQLGTISLQQHYRRIAPPLAINNVTQPPIALAAIPNPDGPPKLIAAITLSVEQRDCRLVIADIQANKLAANLPLWKLSLQLPALAVDSRGEYLALSGNDQHEIWVYRLNDVLSQQVRRRHTLKSAAHVIRSASFVQKNDRLGLELSSSNERPGPATQQLSSVRAVLDVNQRTLVNATGWTAFNASSPGWQAVARTEQERLVVDVREGNQLRSSIKFDLRNVLDVSAFCPPSPGRKRTLLAAAVRQNRGSQLWLIDARTGERLSILAGVSDRVTSLTFSGDGRFLAAASLENIARLWWLADIEKEKPLSGVLEGLAVERNPAGQLVVREDTSGTFAPNDVLSFPGPDPAVPAREFESEAQFYEWVAEKRPGDALTVDVTSRDNRRRQVNAKIQRAIDARGPLCSLFVFADRDRHPTDWVCWDPLGRYDSPREAAETRLGWHFNLPDSPGQVRFVTAARYRDQNFRKGLLEDHLQQGPVLMPPAAALPDPQTLISLRQGQKFLKAPEDVPIVTQGNSLAAFVRISNFPEQAVASVTGKIDGADYAFTETASGLWETDLSGAPVNRALQTLAIQIETAEKTPRKFQRSVTFRRLPPAPSIQFEPNIPERAEQAALNFAVAVSSPIFEQGETADIVVKQLHNGEEVAKQSQQVADQAGQTFRITLRPGQNEITVAARHSGANSELADSESVQRTFFIRLAAPQRPELELTGVSFPGNEQILPLESLRATDRAQLTLHGRATVPKPDRLERLAIRVTTPAEDSTGQAAEPVTLADDGTFQQTVRFRQPGSHRVQLTATTNRGLEDESTLTIDVRPALPELISAKLLTGGDKLPENGILIEGRHSSEVTLLAKFAAVQDGLVSTPKATVALRTKHDDGSADFETEISTTRPEVVQQNLELQPGVTEVSLILRNPAAEGEKETKFTQRLVYRRPPRIVRVEHPQTVKTNTLSYTAIIESVEKPVARLEQNGVKVPEPLLQIQPEGSHPALWRLTAELPLDVTRPQIQWVLSAENSDGVCLFPHASSVEYRAPPPPIPEVRADFPSLIRTQSSSLVFKFRVRSSTPLKTLKLVVDAGPDHTIDIDPATLPEPNQDRFVSFEQRLSLEEIGAPMFRLSLEAVNDAGLARTLPAQVNYVAPPVPLVIDGLGPDGGKPLALRRTRMIRYADASHAELVLQGHLDKSPGRAARIKVWVNGFLQNSVDTDPDGSFLVPLVMNLPKENRISFELPDLPVDELHLPQLSVDCRSHVSPAVLRLVIVLGKESDNRRETLEPKAMERRIVNALKAREPQIAGFRMEPAIVFEGDFDTYQMQYVLNTMAMSMWSPRRPVNDVLVMYYRGKETLIGDSDFELSTGNPNLPIDRNTLVSWLGEIPGAHLLLLDVASQPVKRLAERLGKSDDRLGLLRVAWSKPSKAAEEPSLLISGLQRAVRNSPEPGLNLRDAVVEMSNIFQSLRSDDPELAFDHSIPEDLERLILTPP